jgi:hypothetical protein
LIKNRVVNLNIINLKTKKMETRIEKVEVKNYGTANMMFTMFSKDEAYHLVTSDKNICKDAFDRRSEKFVESINLLIAQCEAFNRSIGKLSGSVVYNNV